MSEQIEVGVIGNDELSDIHGGTMDPTASIEKRVLGLAWPVISENFLETMLGIVDTWLVSSLGAIAGCPTDLPMEIEKCRSNYSA